MPFIGVLFAGAIAGVGASMGSELAERYILPYMRRKLKECEDARRVRDDADTAIKPVPRDEWVDRDEGK